MNYSIISMLVLASAFNVNTHAENALESPTPAKTELVTSQEKGSELQLEVRQMPLTKVMDAIAKKTNIPIHYSVLPEGFITATCVGASLKPVLECLLNHKADIIVRYSHDKSNITANNQIAEAWILGSKLEATPSNQACTKTNEKASLSLIDKDQETESKPDQSDELLKIAKSNNASARADAIGALLTIGRTNDPQIKAMLEEAIHDQDANVRAQAVSTLTLREDFRGNATEVIQEAMQDSSAEVRMMAVEGIRDDIGLLQQAINDSDEVIRTLATSKLEELMNSQKK